MKDLKEAKNIYFPLKIEDLICQLLLQCGENELLIKMGLLQFNGVEN